MHAMFPREWTVKVPFSSHPLPLSKMVEAVLFAVATALIYCFFALLGSCNEKYVGRNGWIVRESWVQFNCEKEAFNPTASLLLTTSEGAVRRLFSRTNTGDIFPHNILLAFIPYTLMNVALTGIPVPSGNFTGTLLIGAFVGRFVGSIVHEFRDHHGLPEDTFALPGIYAMIGAAAMLSGFKQISMGVVVFIVEAANNLSLTPALMLSVFIALLVNKRYLKSGFDEEQIARKNIAFLHAEPPHGFDRWLAEEIMEIPEDHVPLRPTTVLVRRLLEKYNDPDKIFPVIDDGMKGKRICRGFTTCKRLEQVLDCPDEEQEPFWEDTRWVEYLSYTIPGKTTAKKVYPLFTKLREEVICVVDDSGNFQGMITRDRIIQKAKEVEELGEDSSSDVE
jgi:hypothetical protein